MNPISTMEDEEKPPIIESGLDGTIIIGNRYNRSKRLSECVILAAALGMSTLGMPSFKMPKYKSVRGVPGNIRTEPKIGRNETCPKCDSGKKFKKCCMD